jgi:hypothetical protein
MPQLIEKVEQENHLRGRLLIIGHVARREDCEALTVRGNGNTWD